MKKKILLIIAVILLVLLIPIPTGMQKDGGTKEYIALTYKVVHWKRLIETGTYEKTRVYFFPKNFKSISELWEEEDVSNKEDRISFRAVILEMSDDIITVEPCKGEDELENSDKITFSSEKLEKINASVGSTVDITYDGTILETYPAQIYASSWQLSHDLRETEYSGEWFDSAMPAAEKVADDYFSDITITDIYKDCFFATYIIPSPLKIKINGVLPDSYCVGDNIATTQQNVYIQNLSHKLEADLISVKDSDLVLDPDMCYKPVVYLYPQKETNADVRLTLNGSLSCTYPRYENGWHVTAQPDGTLTDTLGKTYNYLYWEGNINTKFDFSKGFCIKGSDTAAFLEDALQKLGLNRREANEFIVYWLPLMESNPYNIISFQGNAYTAAARLSVSPTPDTVIRVFMAWKSSDTKINLEKQELSTPSRTGFTVVEWGGAQVK